MSGILNIVFKRAIRNCRADNDFFFYSNQEYLSIYLNCVDLYKINEFTMFYK